MIVKITEISEVKDGNYGGEYRIVDFRECNESGEFISEIKYLYYLADNKVRPEAILFEKTIREYIDGGNDGLFANIEIHKEKAYLLHPTKDTTMIKNLFSKNI